MTYKDFFLKKQKSNIDFETEIMEIIKKNKEIYYLYFRGVDMSFSNYNKKNNYEEIYTFDDVGDIQLKIIKKYFFNIFSEIEKLDFFYITDTIKYFKNNTDSIYMLYHINNVLEEKLNEEILDTEFTKSIECKRLDLLNSYKEIIGE